MSASSPSLNKQGDLQPKNMATSDGLLLQTDAPTDEKALKQWVDSMALKAGLARYQGSCGFYGTAKVVPGCIIELKGWANGSTVICMSAQSHIPSKITNGQPKRAQAFLL